MEQDQANGGSSKLTFATIKEHLGLEESDLGLCSEALET